MATVTELEQRVVELENRVVELENRIVGLEVPVEDLLILSRALYGKSREEIILKLKEIEQQQ